MPPPWNHASGSMLAPALAPHGQVNALSGQARWDDQAMMGVIDAGHPLF